MSHFLMSFNNVDNADEFEDNVFCLSEVLNDDLEIKPVYVQPIPIEDYDDKFNISFSPSSPPERDAKIRSIVKVMFEKYDPK